MIDLAREVARVRYPMLALSAGAWGVLAFAPGLHVHYLAICGAAAGSLSLTLTINSLSALAMGWALMVIAMMAPLVVPAVHHVRFSSLARRRPRSIALFAAGYGGVWIAAGAVLTCGGIATQALAPGSFLPAAFAGLVAFVWQASPYKQTCLYNCHDNRPLRTFGPQADIDALCFGGAQGIWCVASCGALMLIPMLLPHGHLAAMAAVAILIFCERLENPAPPRWRLRGLGRAQRMLAARIRLRWRRLRQAVEAWAHRPANTIGCPCGVASAAAAQASASASSSPRPATPLAIISSSSASSQAS